MPVSGHLCVLYTSQLDNKARVEVHACKGDISGIFIVISQVNSVVGMLSGIRAKLEYFVHVSVVKVGLSW